MPSVFVMRATSAAPVAPTRVSFTSVQALVTEPPTARVSFASVQALVTEPPTARVSFAAVQVLITGGL